MGLRELLVAIGAIGGTILCTRALLALRGKEGAIARRLRFQAAGMLFGTPILVAALLVDRLSDGVLGIIALVAGIPAVVLLVRGRR